MIDPTSRRRIAAEAAEHLAKLQSQAVTPDDRARLQAWIDESELHKTAWIELSDLWLGIEPLAGELTRARLQPRLAAWAAVAAAALLLIGGGLFAWRQLAHPTTAPSGPATFQTARGEKSNLVLSDGSTVTLDAASRVSVSMEPMARRITVEQGRAVFAVAKDATRPFVVSAGSQVVTATGTKFVVNVTSGEIDVGLVEGRVRVEKVVLGSSSRQPVRAIEMQSGGWLTAPENGEWTVASMAPESMLSWMTGVLVFQNASLEQIASEMNRYAQSPIVIGDAATARKRLSAVVAAGDTETIRTGVLRLGIANVRRRQDGALEFYSGTPNPKADAGRFS